MSDEKLTVQLTTEARWSMEKARDKYPSNSDSKLVSEALERTWPTDGSDEHDEEENSEETHEDAEDLEEFGPSHTHELTDSERAEAEELQEGLNMFR